MLLYSSRNGFCKALQGIRILCLHTVCFSLKFTASKINVFSTFMGLLMYFLLISYKRNTTPM
jgi:hypothetical protein